MPNASEDFLDGNQYTVNGILRYEKIFGRGFVSTGGKETTEEVVKLLNLKPGQKVLDVGCGIGGGAFYMVKNYQVHVHGVDLSKNMLKIGKERAKEFGEGLNESLQVKFDYCDVNKAEFEPASYDVIYTRDCLFHVEEKVKLFTKFLKWLKPGGQLLITEYCHGDGKPSQEFLDYLKQRSYNILTIPEYRKALETVGFTVVKAEDKSGRFLEVLNAELERFQSQRDEFLQEFSESDYNDLIGGWLEKVERCKSGEHKWGLFHARKP